MKTLTKLFLFVILLGVMLLNITCEKKLFAKVTYEGYVYDTIGGKPVSGHLVYLMACNAGDGGITQCDLFLVGGAKTDASGYFKIHTAAARSNRYSPSLDGQSLVDSQIGTSGANLSSTYPKLYLK